MSNKVVRILFYVLPFPIIIISLFVGASQQAGFVDYVILLYKKYIALNLTNVEEQELNIANNIIFNIRLPRVLLTFMIGSALSSSGVVLQAVLRNPLVDSYILGISSAAAFGAALAMFLGWYINLLAFIMGAVAVIITFLIAKGREGASIVSVVLSGMIISGMFTALLSVVQYLANPYQLSAIVQWTMGNLHAATWAEVQQSYIPIIIGIVGIYLFRWRLNLLALGDVAAKSVGVNPLFDKLFLITMVTLMTATSVAVAGIISMYGLFLPHIVRMILGADNKEVVKGSIFFGGAFLLIIDNISRSLFEFELPIGIFTMIIGGLFFIYLMKKNKLNWS
ncbi:iron ABC transporter permease [Riemerella anatipestifer]|uniref:Transport system permease protein n=1 Tax=Riemerella anatipestifer (strain ATCC 11845 / DSM 15868 / JCM 9532 / NCTC 11014) TaxID=693978 RepID=E4TC37_RIEAD|nr:iron ABC transporter permease [Riemerella anatipestifer]ADQ82084.1 transport system permease protein [Riemerella anatipestifer ATCC 11845 = DSM 15868]ADZ12417.1 ABC-type transporter, permease components [Riemerella anatipestifer RA-GD]AFD56086.1 transport system permease protein [Riemerella anatipestifer ATCC 11845 = DSM 15868]AKP69304.1 transport system permease [Riemerella anatipestifer]AKP71192.1 iron transporter [Riemerella anatipestifer]